MSSTVPGPQPTPSLNAVIKTIFGVVNMAIVALSFVPGIPAAVLVVTRTAMTDIEAAYMAYTANPTADLYDEIVAAIEAAMASIKAVVHP